MLPFPNMLLASGVDFSFVGAITSGHYTSSTAVVLFPTQTRQGDLIVVVANNSAGGSLAPIGSGWTMAAHHTGAGAGYNTFVYWRYAAADYAVTQGESFQNFYTADPAIVVVAYRGATVAQVAWANGANSATVSFTPTSGSHRGALNVFFDRHLTNDAIPSGWNSRATNYPIGGQTTTFSAFASDKLCLDPQPYAGQVVTNTSSGSGGFSEVDSYLIELVSKA